MDESKELLPAEHDAFVGPRSPPVARGGGAGADGAWPLEKGEGQARRRAEGGKGWDGGQQGPGDKRRTGDETGKATVVHPNQPPLSRLSPRPLSTSGTIFVFTLSIFLFHQLVITILIIYSI